MEKIRGVLDGVETVLGGLTRGLNLDVLDTGVAESQGRLLSFVPRASALGVVLPSNSPGVHALWVPTIALKTALVLKPGGAEPWTPYRVIQAFLQAGAPPEAFGYYPTDHAGAGELLRRCGRGIVFGDVASTRAWHGDPRVEVHGPGYSKVLLGPDAAAEWPRYLDVMASSVAENGGRSCVNASGVWTPAHAREIAEALADRLVAIRPRAEDDPEAQLAPFANAAVAQAISSMIDRELEVPGAVDLTASRRSGPRMVTWEGATYLLPTVVLCESPAHPLANREFLFPFASVVPVAPAGSRTPSAPPSPSPPSPRTKGCAGGSSPRAAPAPAEPRAPPDLAGERDQPHGATTSNLYARRAPEPGRRLMRVLQSPPAPAGCTAGAVAGQRARRATVARPDVSLLPVYTPTRTDEDNVSDGHVFLGGISVYLEQHVPLLRRTPAVLDWIWDRPWSSRLATGARSPWSRGSSGLTVSTLREEGNQAKELRKLVKYLEGQPPFDVAVIPMSMLLGLAPPLKRTLGVPICCTLQGDDLFLDGLGEPWRSESLALIRKHASAVDAFIATSAYYADHMAGYLGVPRERIRHVPLGINLRGYTAAPRAPHAVPTIGYFARIAPRRACTSSPRPTRILRQERGLPAARLEAGTSPPSIATTSAASRRNWSRGPRGRVPLPRRAGPGGQDRVPARGRCLLRAQPLCGAERALPARGDGQRGAGGVAAPRRVPRDHREDRGRSALRAERRCLAGGPPARAAARHRGRRRDGTAGRRGRSAPLQRRRDGRVPDRSVRRGDALSRRGRTPRGRPVMLEVRGLRKEYPTPRGPLSILQDVDLTLAPGESLCIMGPSGSGKSTLLYILGTLEPPTSGSVRLGGRDPFAMPERELAAFRNASIGFVFQDHCLLPQCTVVENVLAPTLVSARRDGLEARAKGLLEAVGLAERLEHRPAQLSGGEKQRVALARALVLRPSLLPCDEPTGNLDAESAGRVADLLLDLHRREQAVLVLVTHSAELAARFSDRRRLAGGRLVPA
jgi:predicted ABC-type transport system involved in lysophospholipase L1 biosynthesis ATPase subunit